jgi:hypothetical protein
MKKIALLLLITMSFVSCKRKQDIRDLESGETLAQYPVQCYNGIQDSTESGVDCGGPCAPCNVVTPSCTPLANSMKIGTSTSTASVSSCGLNGSNYEISGSYSGGSFTITLGSAAPDLSISYSIISSSILHANEAEVYVNDSWYGSLSPNSGTLYMTKTGNKYTAIICGASAYSWVTSQSYTITGKVTCP